MPQRVLEEDARARRYGRALVALTRDISTQQSLESGLARICEVAAETLGVERVNVWRLDPDRHVLRCIHSYDQRNGGVHNPPGYDETLDVREYRRWLDDVRLIDAEDVQQHEALTASREALGDYFERHGVASLLDAPVRGDGELLGVVGHEQVGRQRAWSVADRAFAASIADCVVILAEICRRRAAERRLRYLELHDPQTDLPNRDHLLEVVHSALRTGEGAVTVIHLQVEIDEGDRVAGLAAVASALRDGIGTEATLARVRHDAFALVPHRSLRGVAALDLAGRCMELAEQAGTPSGLRAWAGIAFSHDLAEPSADRLLRNAELAVQRVRSMGGLERCEVFDAGRHRGLLKRMRTERALREAHERGNLHVHYQPVVDLAAGRIRGAEALLRWHDGAVWRPACEFIDVAESSGLIVPLGRWVLVEACTAAAAWQGVEGEPPPQLSVNVSARQVAQPGLVPDVAAALEASGLAPGRLWLELTETALLPDTPIAIDALGRLRALGVHMVLDDFGTGHSSFARLKHLPIDGLKIDRDFVADLPDDPLDMAIVCSVVAVADKAGLVVVAEGVETPRQADALLECGVAKAQGYHYGRAMPEADLRGMFARPG